jgi:hypothetical protein
VRYVSAGHVSAWYAEIGEYIASGNEPPSLRPFPTYLFLRISCLHLSNNKTCRNPTLSPRDIDFIPREYLISVCSGAISRRSIKVSVSEEPVALIGVEDVPGTSDVQCPMIRSSPLDRYLGKYRIVSLVSTCFIDSGSLSVWFDFENERLQEEHNKGESPQQPQTPSVGSTMATGASIPPSGTVQTAPQLDDDDDDGQRSQRSDSTAATE